MQFDSISAEHLPNVSLHLAEAMAHSKHRNSGSLGRNTMQPFPGRLPSAQSKLTDRYPMQTGSLLQKDRACPSWFRHYCCHLEIPLNFLTMTAYFTHAPLHINSAASFAMLDSNSPWISVVLFEKLE